MARIYYDDQEVAHQILDAFAENRVRIDGVLRRNQFASIHEGDFQRGLNCAVQQGWIKIDKVDRYTYLVTELGYRTKRESASKTTARSC